jgi:hypothetical protein
VLYVWLYSRGSNSNNNEQASDSRNNDHPGVEFRTLPGSQCGMTTCTRYASKGNHNLSPWTGNKASLPHYKSNEKEILQTLTRKSSIVHNLIHVYFCMRVLCNVTWRRLSAILVNGFESVACLSSPEVIIKLVGS